MIKAFNIIPFFDPTPLEVAMSIQKIPQQFTLSCRDEKLSLEVLHGPRSLVGDGFVYNENDWGYGLKLNSSHEQLTAFLQKVSENRRKFLSFHHYRSSKSGEARLLGHYVLCDIEVQALGQTVRNKVIVFFTLDDTPFYVDYNEKDPRITISKFHELRQTL